MAVKCIRTIFCFAGFSFYLSPWNHAKRKCYISISLKEDERNCSFKSHALLYCSPFLPPRSTPRPMHALEMAQKGWVCRRIQDPEGLKEIPFSRILITLLSLHTGQRKGSLTSKTLLQYLSNLEKEMRCDIKSKSWTNSRLRMKEILYGNNGPHRLRGTRLFASYNVDHPSLNLLGIHKENTDISGWP